MEVIGGRMIHESNALATQVHACEASHAMEVVYSSWKLPGGECFKEVILERTCPGSNLGQNA